MTIKSMKIFIMTLLVGASSAYAVCINDWETARDLNQVVAIARENRQFLGGESEDDIIDWHYRFLYKVPMLKCLNEKGEYKYGSPLYIKVIREDSGEIVGFIAYHMAKGLDGWILFLALTKNAQGKGYGKQLVQYALHHLNQQHGAARTGLGTSIDNLAARNLYEKVGFKALVEREDMVYYTYTHNNKNGSQE